MTGARWVSILTFPWGSQLGAHRSLLPAWRVAHLAALALAIWPVEGSTGSILAQRIACAQLLFWLVAIGRPDGPLPLGPGGAWKLWVDRFTGLFGAFLLLQVATRFAGIVWLVGVFMAPTVPVPGALQTASIAVAVLVYVLWWLQTNGFRDGLPRFPRR